MAMEKLFVKALQWGVAENVHIMDHDGLSVVEERQGLDDTSSRVHELSALVGDVDVGVESVGLDESNHLLAKMMDVDDDGVEAVADEVFDISFKQGLVSDFHQGFGGVVGEFLESCAQACGKDHGGMVIHGFFVRYG